MMKKNNPEYISVNYMKVLLGSHYFIYFGTLGIFLPYFNLFCRHLGFSGFEIGLISSVKTAAVVIFPVLWAMAADRFNARKSILIFCTSMSCLLWLPLFFTRTFTPLFLVIACQSIFYAPIVSFIEAFAMDILGKEKRKYGNSRVWGSIAFILLSMGLGKVLTFKPIDIIIPMMLGGMVLQVLLTVKLPPTQSAGNAGISSGLSGFRNFFSFNTSMFLFAAFLMLTSHGAYYGFFSIYLESLGFSTGFIGFAWGVASVAEIAVMVFSGPLFSRFTLKRILALSFFAAVIRWFLLFATSSEIFHNSASTLPPFTLLAGLILFSQLLHALTYGAFHVSSILAVDKLSQESGATFGQAVNNAVTYGAGMMAGFMLSGMFYDTVHAYLFLASAGCALFGLIVIFFVIFE
ncbi:MFS transporter [Desulfamplus magnetovallimortis]|nr:MFS transporter [Desulfamplus magnetovallimortis]